MRNLALILVSVSLGAVGQLLMKKGMMVFGETSVARIWSQLWSILTIPYILIGFTCFAVSAVLWLVVVSKLEVSYAYPMVSLSYILILIVSYFWFGENVTTVRILGVVLICAGVIAITQTHGAE